MSSLGLSSRALRRSSGERRHTVRAGCVVNEDAVQRSIPLSALLASMASAQKKRHGASLYLLWVNRPLGRLLAAIAYKRNLTPSAVTLAGGVITYAACGVIAINGESQLWAIVAAIALMIGYALDSADGQLARISGKTSLSGEFLDRCIDMGKFVLLHASIVAVLLRSDEVSGPLVGLAGTVFLASLVVQSFASILRTELSKRKPSDVLRSNASEYGLKDRFKSVFYLGKEYGTVCVFVAFLPLSVPFFTGYVILALITLGTALLFVVKWHGELLALDQVA